MLVTQVDQIVREIAEVVAGADRDVVTQMAVEPQEYAASPIVGIRQVEQAAFGQRIPAVEEMPVGTQHIQVGTAVKVLGIDPVHAHLPEPVSVLAPYCPL